MSCPEALLCVECSRLICPLSTLHKYLSTYFGSFQIVGRADVMQTIATIAKEGKNVRQSNNYRELSLLQECAPILAPFSSEVSSLG